MNSIIQEMLIYTTFTAVGAVVGFAAACLIARKS